MSILWVGGEDIDFPVGSMSNYQTSSGRSGYSRAQVQGNDTSNSTIARSTLFPGGAVTSCWLSFRLNPGNSTASRMIFGLIKDQSTSAGLYIGCSATKTLALYTFDGTTKTIIATESGSSIVSGGPHHVDMQVINYGASATVNVYVDNPLVLTYSGNVAVSGVTSLSACGIAGPNDVFGDWSVSEIIVADEDTRLFALVTMAPNANGTTQQWTGALSNVNQVSINDLNSDYTNTIGQDQQYNLIDLPAGVWAVRMIKVIARATHTSGSTATGLQLGVNSGGTVNVGATQPLTTLYAPYERYMGTNPITTNPWQQSEMNPLQIDLRSA